MRAIQDTVPKSASRPQSNRNRSTVASFMTVNRTRFHRVGSGKGIFEKAMVGDAVRFCELKVLLRLLLLWRVLVGLPRGGDEGEAPRCAPTDPDVFEWL